MDWDSPPSHPLSLCLVQSKPIGLYSLFHTPGLENHPLFDRQYQETISNPLYMSEMWWSNGQCTGLRVKRSGFKTWPVHVLCSRARHHALTVSLSTQENKWVQAKCKGSLIRRVTLGWTSTPSREEYFQSLHVIWKPGSALAGWMFVCRLNLMV